MPPFCFQRLVCSVIGQDSKQSGSPRHPCNGEIVPLFPKAVETLTILVQNPGRLLEREALMEAVWPDATVEDANLTVAISQLRKALDQNSDSGEFIQTIARVGYRFVANVCEVVEEPVPLIAESRGGKNGAGVFDGGAPRQLAPAASSSTAERPVRRKTDWIFLAGALAIVSVGVLFFLQYRAPSLSVPISSASLPERRGYTIPEKSIGVLPLENLSDDKQNAYFAGGIQDEIISDLAKIADLKVISRTSANLYKSGNPRNSREIGQQLGVAHLLEGSVQRIGNRIRVHAQLIDTRTDTHVWTQTYDRDVADLFAVQSEISQAIADQLHAKISPAEKVDINRPPTADLTAFALYSRAKDLVLTTSYGNDAKANLLEAINLLNQALARDPSFFRAYCLLGSAHNQIYFLGDDHTPGRLALAEAAVDAAFRIHPNAGEAHLARAENLYQLHLDYDGALAELEIARRTLPNDSRVFELRGYIERRRGRWEQSTRDLERAVELDPRNVDLLQQAALTYDFLRRYADEKEIFDRIIAIEPNNVQTKAARRYIEFDWKADTQPLHQLLDKIRAKDPVAVQSVSDNWMVCALADRDAAAAKNAMLAAGENTPFSDHAVHFSRSLAEGVIARMTKDDAKARAAFTIARSEQEKIIQAQPDYGPPLCVLGLIDAALGRKDDALQEGRRAVELLPVQKDSINGPLMIKYLAMIAAWIGDKDLACEQLAAAARIPGPLGYGELKLLPFWDPLRGDPRFEEIVNSLAPR
jgi:serine/threonine-protein kinase